MKVIFDRASVIESGLSKRQSQQSLAWVMRSVLATALFTGCMTTPGSQTNVDARSSRVSFSGYTPFVDEPVALLAAPSRTGRFENITGAVALPDRTPIDWFGNTYFAWEVRGAIPAALWGTRTVDGCSVTSTYVRATTRGAPLYTFEEPFPAGPVCLARFESDVLSGLEECASPSSPTIEIRTRNIFRGDVVIQTLEDLAAHRCHQVIIGTLSIPDSSVMLIDLPMLERVEGDVNVFLRVEGPSDRGVYTGRRFHLPQLERITGALSYEQTAVDRTFAGLAFELGFNNLSYLGQKLTINFGVNGISPSGLGNLSSAREVEVNFRPADVGGSWLSRLRRVDGNVTFTGGYSVVHLLPELAEIRGDLSFRAFGGGGVSRVLNGLRTVRGQLTLTSTGLSGMQSLTQVGSLSLDRFRSGFFGSPGPHSLRVPVLNVTDTAPFPEVFDNIRLAANAPVTLRDLDASSEEICNFLIAQPDYTGVPEPDLGGITCAGL